MTTETAVLIYGDSGLGENARAPFSNFIHRMQSRAPAYQIAGGICDCPGLSLKMGLNTLVTQGAQSIVCVPATLFGAAHDIDNIPSELIDFATQNPHIELLYARDLVVDGRLLVAAGDQITNCQKRAPTDIANEDTLLMVVGSETLNPVANSNVAKAARLIWEGMGFGWAETSYCGETKPSVNSGMAHAVKLGFERIIIFPGFLFSDDAGRHIYDAVQAVSTANPNIEVLYAAQITDHPMLLESMMDRISEALNGSNTMNCMLCSYREQIVGHEAHSHQEAHPHTHTHEHTHSHTHDHPKHD